MVKIKGEKKDEASGNKHKEYLIKPKPPNFSRIPAKMTDRTLELQRVPQVIKYETA